MFDGITTLLDRLAAKDCCTYGTDGPWAAEPTALACLALVGHDRLEVARKLTDQLVAAQLADGAVPVLAGQEAPAWTTSLAILAWVACERSPIRADFERQRQLAIEWALAHHGKPADPQPEVGHDPRLLGWSWADNTHSWMEPTAMFVLALKAAGLKDHARTREAIQLVTDRLLPTGGSNFGSTIVLGQATLPQVESTGLAMLALAGEVNTDPRVEASLRYLESSVSSQTPTASLAYGLLGLTAHGRRPASADGFLQQAFERELARGSNEFKLALLALAGLEEVGAIPGPDAEVTP
jgi:hypothetical protein